MRASPKSLSGKPDPFGLASHLASLEKLGCVVIRNCGLKLPGSLSGEEWLAVGTVLGKLERSMQSVNWLIGDWWRCGEHAYGTRRAVVESESWTGPGYQACMDIAWVCAAFETSRRREDLSFSHHREVACAGQNLADELLDWCDEVTQHWETAIHTHAPGREGPAYIASVAASGE